MNWDMVIDGQIIYVCYTKNFVDDTIVNHGNALGLYPHTNRSGGSNGLLVHRAVGCAVSTGVEGNVCQKVGAR